MYEFRKAPYVSNRHHRVASWIPGTTFIHNLLLNLRRTRRVFRPLLPIVLRAIIVLCTAIELHPPSHHGTSIFFMHEQHFAPFLSRLSMLSGIMSSLLSVIFFDIRIFNLITVAALLLHLVCSICHPQKHLSLVNLFTYVCFHGSAILFSTMVGRRRSISRPSVLRKNVSSKGFFVASMKSARHVDILEAAMRVQAGLVAIDFALGHSLRSTTFLFTFPLAILFMAGYCTRKNGMALSFILMCFAFGRAPSPLLGCGSATTLCTLSGALLALTVGPGVLTVDEWLATTSQLCY